MRPVVTGKPGEPRSMEPPGLLAMKQKLIELEIGV